MFSRLAPIAGIFAAMVMEHYFAGTAYAGLGYAFMALMLVYTVVHICFGARPAFITAATLVAIGLGWQKFGLEAGLLCGVPTVLAVWYLHGIFPAALMAGTAGCAYWGWHVGGTWLAVLFGVLGPILVTTVYDVFQWMHSLRRSFPFISRFRWMAEGIRDEIQQYFIERDTDPNPGGTREDWEWCIGASKNQLHDISLGSSQDYHKPGKIHIRNATFPVPSSEPINFKPLVLGAGRRNADGSLVCRKPAFVYGRFGVGDMSFGSLGQNAVESLASGAGRAGVLLSTGEGGLTPYHLRGVNYKPSLLNYLGWAVAYVLSFVSRRWRRVPMPKRGYIGSGQIMLELGTAKFGCRTATGAFDYDKFAAVTANPHVVAIKLKMAQGAKPGGGGILPGAKVTKEIASIRGIPEGKDCHSPNTWSEFHDVPSMMAFIARLQAISGKPVGVKIVIGREDFINEVAEWMRDNPNHGPDFIHVDGGEGGTGAAPLPLADYVGMSILKALPLVDNVLRKNGVRDRVILMSSGKVFNPSQLFIQLALGADYVFGARGFMNAMGCIRARRCAEGTCPTGIATHHKWLQRALVPRVKYIRVANYAEAMHSWLKVLLRVTGHRDTHELSRCDLTIVAGSLNETGMELYLPYPKDQEMLPLAPIPESYGLTAPLNPPALAVGQVGFDWVPEPEPIGMKPPIAHQLFQ
ncbi:MAG: FMN-binding glutamate synthase family protein [Candidatus Obscuribacterales bacterium]|nr:FMN-binding glutamate synthase family protein [Candidatus Obscuribacterales bacterium]